MTIKDKTPKYKNKPVILFFVASLLLLSIFLSLYQKSASTNAEIMKMDYLVLPDHNFKILYPKTWIGGLTPQGNHGDQDTIAVIFAPGYLFLNVTIALAPNNIDTVSSLLSWVDERTSTRFVGFKAQPLTSRNTPYFSGFQRQYSINAGSPVSHEDGACIDFYFQINTSWYVTSFCSLEKQFQENLSIFDEMIESIQFLDG
jgi:hypothetical protein